MQEDRNKGYDPRPESMREDKDIKEEIKTFLVKAHGNQKIDKKTGKKIHSNFYCLYANMQIDQEENEETAEDPVVDPVQAIINSNWLNIETKYKDYLLDPFDLDEEDLAKEMDEIKSLFMENLKQSLECFANDPLNTEKAIHVSGSESQSGSKTWKKARYCLLTASWVT